MIDEVTSASILQNHWRIHPERDYQWLPDRFSSPHLYSFSCCSWGSQGNNTEVVFHSLLQWTTFCQTSPPWPIHLGWPHRAWLSFIELDKGVVHVIRLTSFLWVLFMCVCPLMPSATPTILLEFFLPWTWGISSWPLQQSTATAPYLEREVSPHRCPSWPWMWNSSSRPSCPHAATTPWTWGCIWRRKLTQYCNHC